MRAAALLVLLSAAIPGLASANPCATACGEVVASCEGTYDTFTANGVSSDATTFWELVVVEHYAAGDHAPTHETTGATATLFHSAGPYFWGPPLSTEAWFYADGILLGYAHCL